ncbi:hypothetical protein ACFC0S_14895 [Streptomyces sp. NPDC056084]|uniref:hypothetical protein n=1 Tax=unclassified Streptomyces TaxID=2593676 RepID=UPI0035D82B8C
MPAEAIDPGPFLSTVTTASAALVAIVGGLLAARFVTLTSEQEGAQRVLEDVDARRAVAVIRSDKAEARLLRFELSEFFDRKVVRAVNEGAVDAASLRGVGTYSSLTDEEIEKYVVVLQAELRRADEALAPMVGQQDLSGWEDFSQAHSDLPVQIEEAWEVKYWQLVSPQPAPRSRFLVTPSVATLVPVSDVVRARMWARRDELRAQCDRSRQQQEDLENEVERLRLAREAIVRPKGLGLAFLTLSFFTLVGIVVPVWIMSQRPQDLTSGMADTVLGLFLAGLVTLLGHMAWLALRLARGGPLSADYTDHVSGRGGSELS